MKNYKYAGRLGLPVDQLYKQLYLSNLEFLGGFIQPTVAPQTYYIFSVWSERQQRCSHHPRMHSLPLSLKMWKMVNRAMTFTGKKRRYWSPTGLHNVKLAYGVKEEHSAGACGIWVPVNMAVAGCECNKRGKQKQEGVKQEDI